MTVEQKRKRIQTALNSEFVDLDLTQAQRERLLWQSMHMEDNVHTRHAHLRSHRTGGNSVRLKTKMSFSFVLLLILFCLSVTALAVGILINGYYERVAQMDASGQMTTWGLDDKISFVNVMREFEFPMDETDYSTMIDETRTVAERETAADRIIQQRYGELIRAEVEQWYQKPADISDIAPNEVIIFQERYMAEHPEGIRTKEDYLRYTDALGYYLRDVYYPAYRAEAQNHSDGSTPIPVGTEAYAKSALVSTMTEVFGWDADAADSVNPQIHWDEEYQLWIVSGEVSKESMVSAFNPVLDGENVVETENGYKLTILVDTRGNIGSSSLDKDAFIIEHKNDVDPVVKISIEEATQKVKTAVMQKFGISESDLAVLFYDVEYGGVAENHALLDRYVFHTHYAVNKENVYGAVINRVTGEVTDVFSYQTGDMTPAWRLIFYSAEVEQDNNWYVRWPLESKQQLLVHLNSCGIKPEHSIWQLESPSAEEIDSFVAEVCNAQGYISVINTSVMAQVLLGDREQWSDADHALYAELNERYHLGSADAVKNLRAEASEIDADTAIDVTKAAFCKAWNVDVASMMNWRFESQQVHDDFLGRAMIYYRVNITVPPGDDVLFHGRNNFSYRVMIDGTMIDASLMPEWYSPEQEKAIIEEMQLYDNETFHMFDRYAQRNNLLMDYEDFFHWPLEHKKACADEMRVIIQQRIAADPNYSDPRLIAFARHVYGIPTSTMIDEQAAISAGWKKLREAFDLTDLEMTYLSPEIILLDITDPAKPFYQIGFSAEDKWTSALKVDMQPATYYVIEVDANNGEIITTYTYSRNDGETGIDAWNRWY